MLIHAQVMCHDQTHTVDSGHDKCSSLVSRCCPMSLRNLHVKSGEESRGKESRATLVCRGLRARHLRIWATLTLIRMVKMGQD